jgi:dCMP deaminase
MGEAQLNAMRSKDPCTQVGAVIVSTSKRPLTTGYNGTPGLLDDKDMLWGKTSMSKKDTKYPYVVHAELNAILNYRGNLSDFNGATIYVTLFPCYECAKALAQVSIGKVVYGEKRSGEDTEIAEFILGRSNIQTIQYVPSYEGVTLHV